MDMSDDDWCRPDAFVRDANYFSLADIIATVEFDHTGNYLATGDKGGRVVLFERNETVSHTSPFAPRSLGADEFAEENLRIQVSH